MDTTSKVAKAALGFYNDPLRDTNGRYRSWEHCYKEFHDARLKKQKGETLDYDYLSLHLAFYLASWGMYRGSSFLLQRDYKVHEKTVRKVLSKEYDLLQGIACEELKEECAQELLWDLRNWLRQEYGSIRSDVMRQCEKCEPKTDTSDILVSKILMGTLGCVPAYDNYFVKAVRKLGVASGLFGKESVKKLISFYESNRLQFDAVRKSMRMPGTKLIYPQMKFLDMGFWQMGKQIEDNEKRSHDNDKEEERVGGRD